jgi:hypothetical protein
VQLIVKPSLSKAWNDGHCCKPSQKLNHLLIAHGSLDDGARKSSVGSAESAESTLTTPQVDVESATDRSSGMKASPLSVRFASLAVLLSARDLASISPYCGELEQIEGVKYNHLTDDRKRTLKQEQ